MALNSNALATVADFNADTGNSTTATAERFINAASDAIEKYLGRVLTYSAAVVETLPGNGTTRLSLSRTPVRAITSVVTVDSATIDSTSYSIESADAGFVYRADGWQWSAGVVTALESFAMPGTEKPFYVVTYGGGYSLPAQTQTYPLPSDIIEACLSVARTMYFARQTQGDIVAESTGAASVSYGAGRSVISSAVAQMLAPYRRFA